MNRNDLLPGALRGAVKKILLFCMAALLHVTALYAQSRCGNGLPADTVFRRPVAPASVAAAKGAGTVTYIPLQFHLISCSGQETNWYAGDTSQVDRAIDTANRHFRAADIQFCKAGPVDHIVNDTFCEENYNTIYFRYRDVHTDTTVIHVYIPVRFSNSNLVIGHSFGTADNTGSQPYTYGMSGPAVIIESSVLPDDTNGKGLVLTHELGHFFGLLHCNNYSFATGYELANGSNGATTGDFCRDSPAEYGNFFVDQGCVLIPSLLSDTDANGDTLHPDPYNIMSSNVWSLKCRRYFTPDQVSRIRYFHQHYLAHLVCKSGSTGIALTAGSEPVIRIAPNPAYTDQQISIESAGNAGLSIDLFNTAGQLAATVCRTRCNAGNTAIRADLSTLPQGIYYYRIVVGDTVRYRKVVKIN